GADAWSAPPLPRSRGSELDAGADLEGSWAAGTEDLAGATGGLAESKGLVGWNHLVEIRTKPAEVGDVEDVETFDEDRCAVALVILESLREAHVLRVEVITQRVIRR